MTLHPSGVAGRLDPEVAAPFVNVSYPPTMRQVVEAHIEATRLAEANAAADCPEPTEDDWRIGRAILATVNPESRGTEQNDPQESRY